jgi:hypothetical protein
MAQTASSTLFMWTRLDLEGQDFCRFTRTANGYRFDGTALFYDGRPCALHYEVETTGAWITRRARLRGCAGAKRVDLHIRTGRGGRWLLNGVPRDRIANCIDLDLGITPATNQIAIRRLALRIGQEAQAPAAYVAYPSFKLSVLEQTYRRISRNQYQYEAPIFGYSGVIRVDRVGAVEDYPGLFRRVRAVGR